MELFSCAHHLDTALGRTPELIAPLGAITISVALDERMLLTDLAYVAHLPGVGWISSWEAEAFSAALLCCPVTELLYAEHLQVAQTYNFHSRNWVDAAWFALWRIAAHQPLKGLHATCELVPRTKDVTGGYDGGGQHLIDYRWSNSDTTLSIGGLDREGLAWHAARGDGLPPRWEKELSSTDTIRYADNGFELHLPTLESGEQCELGAFLAWGPVDVPEPDLVKDYDWTPEMAVFLNVGRPLDVILQAVGCV
jgi:hypothetical protein